MKIQNQIRALLVVVALLLAVQLLRPGVGEPRELVPGLVGQLHAQAAQAGSDVVFVPVGNQDVRKFVFWERRSNQIHIYTGSGKFEETWQVGSLGKDLTKK